MEVETKMERIGNLAEFKRGPFGSAVKKAVCVPKAPGTFKLYEQGNVINNDFERGKYYLTKDRFIQLSQFEVLADDLLLTCAGTLGRIAIVPDNIEKGIFNSVLMRIRPDYDKVLRDYIYYYFQSPKIQNDINRQSAGVAIKNLFATKRLKEYTIYYPQKEEQQLIVDEIEKQLTRLDASIAGLQAAKKKLVVYRNSVLEFTLKGEINSFDSSKWRETKLGEISDIRGGFAFKSAEMKESGKYQIIKIGNVKMGKLKLETKPAYLTELDEKIIKKYLVKNKDVLITLTGTKGKRDYGFVSLVETDKLLLLNQRVARIRTSGDIDPKYIELILRSKNLQDQFFEGETGIVGQGNIGMPSLYNLAFKLPSIEQQKQIVQEIESRFSVIDKLEETVDKTLKRAELLRKSILKSAFEGKLINMAGEA